MKKRFYSVLNVLCTALFTSFGLTATRAQTVVSPPYSKKVYGPPPVVYNGRNGSSVKKPGELKLVYGPPVVETWRDARPDADGIYDVAEEMPRFAGGEQAMFNWIIDHQHYPEEAQQANVHGRVMVSFIVKTDGKLDGVMVMRPVHPALDAEAIRLVKAMPRWKPGRHRGEVVPVRYFIPIIF